jgi:starch synthase (maltosyl-transferring)
LPAIAALGFDVVYLPPIHPIGLTHRKGPNNAPSAAPDDPGSPWAIGARGRCHTAVEPALGTLADFDRFVQAPRELGMEVALDYAPHCSPDHPGCVSTPTGSCTIPTARCARPRTRRTPSRTSSRSISGAPIARALGGARATCLLFWIGHGVRTFRVDNPHTKPFAFWEWAIDSVKPRIPTCCSSPRPLRDPKPLRALAALGFSQSYTYFIWRTTAPSCATTSPSSRTASSPTSCAVRSSDHTGRLHAYLQTAVRAAFRVRLLLAATCRRSTASTAATSCARRRRSHPDSEEYLDSEKFQIRVRDWNAPGNLNADLASLNRLAQRTPRCSAPTT